MHTFTVLALLLTTATSFSADTAYSALRVVRAERGDEALKHVIEVRGGTGPWKILIVDSRARAGVREVQVQNGHITKESTPAKAPKRSAPMNLRELNLDSDGVLSTVTQHTANTVPDNGIAYTLSNGTEGNAPVWTVELHNQPEGKVTSMRIAADTGIVIAKSVTPLRDDAIVSGVADGRDKRDPEERTYDEEPVKRKQTSPSKEKLRDAADVAENVAKRVERVGRQIKRFLP